MALSKAQQEFINAQAAAQNLDFSDRARLAAQGASLNLSDEGFARIRSMGGSGTYEDYLADERFQLESARNKPGSLKYEIGGAMVPALASAPFTGGTSIPLTATRLATLGGSQSLASGLGAREGNLKERFAERPESLAAETGLGAIFGAAGPKIMKLGGQVINAAATPFKSMIRALTDQPSEAVETEIRRLAQSAYPDDPPDLAYQKVVERIKQGDIFPDISGQTAIDTRAVTSAAGPGGAVIRNVIEDRADKFSPQSRESLQTDLVPENPQGNIVRAMNETTDELKAAASKEYDDVFDAANIPPSAKLNRAVLDLAKFDDAALTRLNKLIKKRKLPPLFKKNDEGVIELTRNVSLEEGEIVRRSLKDAADVNYRAGEGALGELDSIAEKEIRSILDDDLSPKLKTTRAKWKQIQSVKDTYDESRKIFGKTAEDAEIYIEDMIIEGNLEKIAAMRAGAASALKAKTTGTSPNAVLRNLDNLDRKERIILEKLYPGDSAKEIFNKIARAVQAIETKNVVIGGSQTAATQAAEKRLGTGIAEEVIEEGINVATGASVIRPIIRLASKILNRGGNKLNQEQLEQVARIIVTEDPEIMEKALNNPESQKILIEKVQQIGNLVQRAVGGASAYEAGEGTRRLLDDPNR